ncbi:MAG: hypothetical protein RIC55_10470 [Pirellulaceae bacterium]
MMPTTAQKMLAPACLTATSLGLMLWLFTPVWFGGEMFAYRDAAHYYYPLLQWTAAEWGGGSIPLWNPQENCGVPVLADTTSSVLYPGKLWFALPLDFATRYVLYITSHVALAALTAYLLARRWRASPFAAGVCGLSYAFCGNVLFQYCNVVYLVSAAWLPLALWATDAMLTRRSAWHAVALGGVLALMTLGGDPQAAYHVGLAATLYAVMLWRRRIKVRKRSSSVMDSNRREATDEDVRRTKGRVAAESLRNVKMFCRRSRRHRFALLALAALTGFVLAAVQILPAVEWSRRSARAAYGKPRNLYEAAEYVSRRGAVREDTLPNAAAGLFGEPVAGTHHRDAYDFSVAPWRAAELLWPNISGTSFPINRRWALLIPAEGRVWTPSLYLGLAPLLLALTAWRIRRGPTRVRWLSWVVVVFATASLGWYGVGWLIHEIRCGVFGASPDEPLIGMPVGGLYWWMTTLLPGYAYFRYPAKLLVLATLALSLLAARGWDRTFGGARRDAARAIRWLLIAICGVSLLLAAVAIIARPWILAQFESAPTDDLFGPLDAPGAWGVVLLAFLQTALVSGASWLILLASRRRRSEVWQAALLVLVAIDLGVAHGWLVLSAPRELWRAPSRMEQRIAALDTSDRSSYRVHRALPDRWVPREWGRRPSPDRADEGVAWDRNTMLPKYPSRGRWRMLEAQGTMVNHDYLAVLNIARQYGERRDDEILEPHGAVLEALSTRWIIAPRGTRFPRSEFIAPDANDETVVDADLLACPGAFLRAWLVRDVEVMAPLTSSEPAVVGRRTRDVFFPDLTLRDLRHSAVVEPERGAGDNSPALLALRRLRPASVDDETSDVCRVVVDEPQRVEIEVVAQQEALLVLNDLYYPGWQAEIQAESQAPRAAEILRTDRILRGVLVPSGRHRVAFVYRPRSFYLGALLSVVAWTSLAVGALLVFWRRRLHRTHENA